MKWGEVSTPFISGHYISSWYYFHWKFMTQESLYRGERISHMGSLSYLCCSSKLCTIFQEVLIFYLFLHFWNRFKRVLFWTLKEVKVLYFIWEKPGRSQHFTVFPYHFVHARGIFNKCFMFKSFRVRKLWKLNWTHYVAGYCKIIFFASDGLRIGNF